MKKRSKNTSSREQASLQAELERIASGPQRFSKQKIAKQAGVSPLTVQKVMGGEYANNPPDDPLPSDDVQKCTARQLRGYVEALTRLTLFVNDQGADLDPAAILTEYGISLDWPGVRSAADRVQQKQGVQRAVTDRVLDEIAARPGARIGVLRWPPFVKEGEDVATAWGYRYSMRLVGSVNPNWNRQPAIELTSIDEAINSVLAGSDRCDAVFGIYDTPYRRLRGLSFIHLPGLGVPLGALHLPSAENDQARLDAGGEGLGWRTIIHPQPPAKDQLRAVVIEGEVGHLFLLGACGYQERQSLVVLKQSDTKTLTFRFAREVTEAQARGLKAIFVADRLTCVRVRDMLRGIDESWLGSDIAGERRKSFLAMARQVQFVTKDDHLVPVYRVGLAVRADAARWYELLMETQREELFRNARALTADEYANLLAGSQEIRPLPLEPDLPRHTAHSFAKECLTQLKRLKNEAPSPEMIDRQIQRCIRAWRLRSRRKRQSVTNPGSQSTQS